MLTKKKVYRDKKLIQLSDIRNNNNYFNFNISLEKLF